MSKTRFYLVLALVAMSLIATGCGRKEPPKMDNEQEDNGAESSEKSKESGVGHKVLSFNLEGLTDRGEKKWEVIGRTARSISENEIRLGNIVAKTYGDQEAVITADHGIYDKSKNNVRLDQNVKATIENTGSMLKDQLNIIPVNGGSSKPDTKGGADLQPKEKKKMVITCDGEMEFDYVKNLAYFKDNVKVRSTDGDIDADKMTVNLNPTTKKVNDIVAEGHVKITQKENVAYSNSAKYSEANKTVSLSGNPKIIISQESEALAKEKILEK